MDVQYERYDSLPDGRDVSFWAQRAAQAQQMEQGGDVVRTEQLENYLREIWGKLEGRTVPADAYVRALFQVLRLTQWPSETVALSDGQFEALAALGMAIGDEDTSGADVIPLPVVQPSSPDVGSPLSAQL